MNYSINSLYEGHSLHPITLKRDLHFSNSIHLIPYLDQLRLNLNVCKHILDIEIFTQVMEGNPLTIIQN